MAAEKDRKKALIIPLERLEISEAFSKEAPQSAEDPPKETKRETQPTIKGLGPSFHGANALIRAELDDGAITKPPPPPPVDEHKATLPWMNPVNPAQEPKAPVKDTIPERTVAMPPLKPPSNVSINLPPDPVFTQEKPAVTPGPIKATKEIRPVTPPKSTTGAPTTSVAMLGPPGVGKTYFCKGLVQLFLRPERLGLHVENLTAVVRRGERTQPLEGYLERFKSGSREAPTAPAHGLNLHELVIDWGKEKRGNLSKESGRAAILLNDSAGEILRNLDENTSLQRYVSCAETVWLLLPAWVLARCEADIQGQVRSYRRAIRDFTDEVDWMYDHPERMVGARRFHLIWTMGNDPVVRAWATEVGMYQDWLTAGEALRDRRFLSMARFVAFQKRLNRFLDDFISATPELDLFKHGLSRLRKIGTLRHSLVNVIDDLELDGKAQGGQEVKENLLHVEAPVLTLLSKTLTFGV